MLLITIPGIFVFRHAFKLESKNLSPVVIDLKAIGRPGENATFDPVTRVKSLPKSVRDQLGAMADPGEDFQRTDVVVDESLPWKRLIFAGQSQKYWIVAYEHGGIGHSYFVAIFEIKNEDARIFWISSAQLSSLQQLKTALESGQLSNGLGYLAW